MAKSAGRNLYRRNGVFWARVQIAGRDVRKSLRTSNRAEAAQRLTTLLKDAERIRFGEEGRHKYEDAVVAWAEAHFGGVKESSAHRYQVSLRMLHDHFGLLYLDQINAREIGKYVRARKQGGAINATVRRDLSALSRLIANACALGWMEENPARAWDRSVIKQRKFVIERVDPRSYEACVAKASPTFAAYIRFLLATGLRADEAASLKRADIDWVGSRATVRGKTGRRTITLSPEALSIARATPQHIKHPWLFWSPDGERYTRPSQRFTVARLSARNQAQKEAWAFKAFRLHDLRHEYAIRWVETGGSLYALQLHLGHSSIKTTEIYTEFLTPEQAAMVKGLSAQKPEHSERIDTPKALGKQGENGDA